MCLLRLLLWPYAGVAANPLSLSSATSPFALPPDFVYGVRMPITGYLTVDSLSSWLVAWAITLALPLNTLLPYRPTTSLFAPQIVLSVLAPWAMWMCTMGGALVMQQSHPDHVKFPAELTKGVGYWQLGDNWEATVFTTFMVS